MIEHDYSNAHIFILCVIANFAIPSFQPIHFFILEKVFFISNFEKVFSDLLLSTKDPVLFCRVFDGL